MGWRFYGLVSSLAALAVLVSVSGARADAIDGHWCFANGKRLSIEGPNLVTPGGKQMTGEYDRHGFIYVVPAGESGTGDKVYMVLVDDDTMLLKMGAQPLSTGEAETWRRCSEQVS
jgi:hypothetical protein